jgi:hypothetical protein
MIVLSSINPLLPSEQPPDQVLFIDSVIRLPSPAAESMSAKYDAASIEVLSGLDPVRKRPGMYTDTTRPNHLAQEVIDNSVDEAIAGYASEISVTLFKDGSLEVTDNGRGMPVDKHPKLKLPGVEVILCTLHAGGKSGCLLLMPCRKSLKLKSVAVAKSIWPHSKAATKISR